MRPEIEIMKKHLSNAIKETKILSLNFRSKLPEKFFDLRSITLCKLEYLIIPVTSCLKTYLILNRYVV